MIAELTYERFGLSLALRRLKVPLRTITVALPSGCESGLALDG